MLDQERRAGLETLAAYSDFASQVQRIKRELLSVLIRAKRSSSINRLANSSSDAVGYLALRDAKAL
jgi:hypothetical protein